MNIPPRKILMVHGDKEERGKLAIMLARFDHCISFVETMTQPDEFDLIILDENMTQGAGFVYLQQLSTEDRAKTVYLSSGGKEERRLCRDSMGIYECLEKPVVPIDLAVVVCDFFISCLSNEESLLPTAT
ncbi:MAG: hypothetical protein HOJ79_09370 [Nitrospina sp.]|jgi:DNA-binding response OmpR family regulator|nr:hypothetical protein [Nitrospina sp.]